MQLYLNIVQIIIGVVLIAVILLQTRGGGLSGVFGGSDTSIYRTRRGVERTLFHLTIGLSVVFFIITILSVIQAK